MKKLVKPIVGVVILGVLGYAGGTYYSNKIAKEHVDTLIQKISKEHSGISKITYQGVHANIFSFLEHDIELTNVEVYLKKLPENPLIIKEFDVDNLSFNQEQVPQSFSVEFEGLHIDNANKLLQQSLEVYSTDKNKMPKNKENLKLGKRILDKYLKSNLSGGVTYSSSKKQLVAQFSVKDENSLLMSFDLNFNDYKITKPFDNEGNNIRLAFNNAKLNNLMWDLDIKDLINPKMISKQYPALLPFINNLHVSLNSKVKYSALTKQFKFNFIMENENKKNIDISMNINDIKIGQYSFLELAKEGVDRAISSAYVGLSKVHIDLSTTIPSAVIENMSPLAVNIIKELGYKDYTVTYKHNEMYNPATHLEKSDMSVGLENLASLTANYQMTVDGKIMLEDLIIVQRSFLQAKIKWKPGMRLIIFL